MNTSLWTKVSNGNSSQKYNLQSALYLPRTRSCYFIFLSTHPESLTESLWFGEFSEAGLGAIYPGMPFKMLCHGRERSFLSIAVMVITDPLGLTPVWDDQGKLLITKRSGHIFILE